MSDLISVYIDCIVVALPITCVFFVGNLITSTILTAAFKGYLTFKG